MSFARVPSGATLSSLGRSGASLVHQGHKASRDHHASRRSSFDTQRPRSRCSSAVDLASLGEVPGFAQPSSRASTPHPLVAQESANDTLAYIASISDSALALPSCLYPSWAELAHAKEGVPATSDAPIIFPTCTDELALAEALAPEAAGPVEEVTPHASTACMTPLPEVQLFRGTMANVSYIAELMDNLGHVKTLFSNVAAGRGGGTPAQASAAAKMLARSLSRAATRVRNTVKDATQVLLAPEAMHTLKEFGWCEVVTFNVDHAREVGALEMETHYPTTGQSLAYHRPTPEAAWVQVGTAFQPSPDMQEQLYTMAAAAGLGDLPHLAVGKGSVMGPAVTGSGAGANAGVISLAGLAEQLVAAAQSVQAAAASLQAWLEEQKAAVAAAAAASGAAAEMGSAAEAAMGVRVAVAAGV